MKAIKHSPEYAGPPKNEIAPTPWSHMSSIHAHVVGYNIDGTRYEAHRGQGAETFFWRIEGFVRSQRKVDDKAASIVNTYSQGYDLWKAEEAIKAAEKKNQQPVVFKDNRNNKGGKKPFNKNKPAPKNDESAA